MPPEIYRNIEKTFKVLYGCHGGEILDGTEENGIPFLIEENFKRNLQHLIGYHCPYFGKLLYLYFSRGFDKARITLYRFMEALLIFVRDDERQK